MITIENLCKAYNDKILFKNFHLEIPDSSFLVISGEGLCGGHAGFRKRRDAGTAGGLAAGGQRAADGDTAGDPGETGGWSGGISGGF